MWRLACCAALLGGASTIPVRVAQAQFDVASDEEVLFDPELEGVPTIDSDATQDGATVAADDRTRLRSVLHSRAGVDTAWNDGVEDVFELTQLGLVEIHHQASQNVRLGLGVRGRFHWAMRDGSDPSLDVHRYALDAVPTAAYVDATLRPGLHVRAGYQMIELGRLDVWNATNTLAVYDLRSGPATLPEAAEIAQPAARVDWDLASWLALRAYYVPFFQPHHVTVVGGDYDLGAVLGGDPSLYRALEMAVDRSWVPELGMAGLRALGPEPSFAHPQGALRLTARSAAGELGMGFSTALERLPALRFSDAFAALAEAGDASEAERQRRLEDVASELARGRQPLHASYNRYATASVDGSLDLSPFQLGAEMAYMWNRTLLAAQRGRVPTPDRTDMVHTALKLELLDSDQDLIVIETFAQHAIHEPSDPDRSWFTMSARRLWYGAAAMGRWSPISRLSLEMLVIGFAGPSWFLAPRIQFEAAEGLFAELGGFFVGGKGPVMMGAPRTSLGAVYDGVDQVFIGLRWLP